MPIITTQHGWVLETQRSGYALGLNQAGLLAHRYWGPRLPYPADYPPPADAPGWASFNGPGQVVPEEYPAHGGVKYVEPCLKLSFGDGVRDLVLGFAGAEVQAAAATLLIHLRDAHYPLHLTLHYRVHAAYDIIERWATLANTGDQPMLVERAWSALWHLPPGDDYRLSHLTGRWADEAYLRRDPLPHGVTVLESRRIATGHHHNPWFAIDRGAGEEHGAVWFGVLAWSGNWKLAAEVTEFAATRVGIGLNDWDFAWRLAGGATFTTPASYAGYSAEGFGGASRRLHDLVRAVILPDGHAPRKVFYNSWEATLFDVDEASQIALAEIAAAIGVELFVLDDGWFHGRHDDTRALGDWWPDAQKFPRGLSPLIARVNALGMEFGLWLEPEMVSPASELYRAHPDWVIHFPTRPRTEARHQLMLNLARADVQDHLIARLDRLLGDHNIAFVKWDMNRNASEPGWDTAPGDPRELWVRYVEGVYRVWGELRRRHPRVTWQSCSGGGGRADLGILRVADQIQVSDTIDPTVFLAIQEGFSQIFPAGALHAWVADAQEPHYALAFRFHVGMCGILGIGSHLARWSPAQRAEAAQLIARYKELRPIIQGGDLYRLRSPQEHAYSAVQYLDKARREGALFVFRTQLRQRADLPPIYLRGLEPEAMYTVEGVDGARSGAAWMHAGLSVALQNFQSTVRRIRRVDDMARGDA